jgi:uncharacterized membrane protein YciS (DUF1049 family)
VVDCVLGGLDFRSGEVCYLSKYKEVNILRVDYPNNHTLDVRWHGSPKRYLICVVKDFEWRMPIASYTAKNEQELLDQVKRAIEKADHNASVDKFYPLIWTKQHIERFITRHKFLSCLLGTLCIYVLRAVIYYANGQSVASAHLDGHHSAYQLSVLMAVVLTAVFIIVLIAKRQKGIFKWFLIPVVPAMFAPLHLYIGSLFQCCPLG